MSKSEKVLVRNAVKVVNKPPVKINKKLVIDKPTSTISTCTSDKIDEIDFETPRLHSTLHITKLMKDVEKCENPTETKPKLTFQALNFDPDEKLFHDLVDVNFVNKPSQVKSSVSSYSVLKKDAEPCLANYAVKYQSPEYTFRVKALPVEGKCLQVFNGRTIHQKIIKIKNNSSGF